MRSRTWKLVRLVAPIGLIPLFACLAPPVESPKTTVTQETSVRVEQSVTRMEATCCASLSRVIA